MLKTILIIVVLAIAALLALAATKPDTFSVQRSASIKAPPEKIFPLINDLHGFNTWNPWMKKDPNMKVAYSGPDSGKGAAHDWDGNNDVGKGRLEIMDSTPASKVTMKLQMIKPMEANNTVDFTLEPKGNSTLVTWSMNGSVPFAAKIMHVIFDMDKMVGTDFEAGLANLKVVAEK